MDSTGQQRKYLFVASTGGHLAQLLRLSTEMDSSPDSLWLTFRSPQAESLLAGRRVLYVPYVRSRDLLGVVRASRIASRLLAREKFEVVVSTGAALAVSVLPLARLRRIPTLYIESVSRVEGPSLTGRIIAATRSADLRTQHAGWSNPRWKLHPSVFGTYTASTRPRVQRPKLLVTVGTIAGYRFDALIDAVLATGLADDRTVWQLGNTVREGLPGSTVRQLEVAKFAEVARESDVVVSHAGVGTVLDLLDLGIFPVLVPRRHQRGEHVDDHQGQIAALVGRMGVGRVVEASDLTAEDLVAASGFVVVPGSA